MTVERVISPARRCATGGCEAPARHILHARGKHKTMLCVRCADAIMYRLSLEATPLDGHCGFQRWRREMGLPFPLHWPRYDPLPAECT